MDGQPHRRAHASSSTGGATRPGSATAGEPGVTKPAAELPAALLKRIAGSAVRLKAATWFLILAIPMGLFLLVMLPPFQGQDEPYHFYRAYSITEGYLIEPIVSSRAGAQVETCVIAFVDYHFLEGRAPGHFHLRDAATQPQACNGQVSFMPFEDTAIYSPVPYLPQVIGIGLSRALRLPLFVQFFAGRLAALAAYLAVVYLALRITPRGAAVILVLATLPMSLLLAVTYSADTMTISMAFLMVAAVLRCVVDEQATWRVFLVAAVAAFGLALAKPTYVVLVPLLFLVPPRVFPSRRLAVFAMVAAVGITAAAAGWWYQETRNISLAAFLAPWMGRYDPQGQISFILHHPLGYLKDIGQIFFGTQQGDYLWSSLPAFIGYWRNAAAGSNFPPVFVVVISYVLILQAYLWSIPRTFRWSRTVLLKAALPPLLALASVLAIVTALFVDALGPGGVLLVSGRYFIPTLAVPLASLSVLEAEPPRFRSPLLLVPFIVVMFAWLAVKVRVYFY